MIAPDTSVMFAAFAPWHVGHPVAHDLVSATSSRRLIAHVAFETTSTLSRMPEGERIAARVVHQALDLLFPDDWLQLDAVSARRALATAVDAGIRGGALYDAVISATAAAHGARLVTFDRRGLATYEAMGVEVEVLAA
ncbi:MAG TPA: PIN domain-containing protein [Solirubrobacteraceae bacterium]|nr:PIN domain-containing protein [Solirubrobacteraceae bacterium]